MAPLTPVRLPRQRGPAAVGPTFFSPPNPPLIYGTPAQTGLPAQVVYLPRRLGPKAVGPTFFAALPRVRSSFGASERPTGNLIFGGSLSQTKLYTETRTGALIFGGSLTQSKTGADARVGALILGGTVTQSKTGSNQPNGALILGGTRVEHATFAASRSGTLILGGQLGFGTPVGRIVLGGSIIERNLKLVALAIGKVNARTANAHIGSQVFVYVDITGDSSYTTGGYSLKGSDLGLSELYHIDTAPESAGSKIATYDWVNSKLKVFSAIGTEVSNGTDLHNVTWRVAATGVGFPTLGLR